MRYYNSYLGHDACNLWTSIKLNRFCVFGQKCANWLQTARTENGGGLDWQHAFAMQTNMVPLNFFSVVAPMVTITYDIVILEIGGMYYMRISIIGNGIIKNQFHYYIFIPWSNPKCGNCNWLQLSLTIQLLLCNSYSNFLTADCTADCCAVIIII